jgi:fructosamine-3-kinase
MSIPPTVHDYCLTYNLGQIRRATPLGGGCINNATRLETDHVSLFLKVNSECPPDMFEREAEGLGALAVADGPRIPKVLAFGADFILQEFIEPAPRSATYWQTLGEQMAVLHSHTVARFGFEHNNYIGLTPQVNTWQDDGYIFFAEHRLRYQAELARRRNLINSLILQSLISILQKLPTLIPPQPASVLHGDLWSGNLHTDSNGQPCLIDPAAYYGWAETDLAMLTLFGSVPDSFFSAYESVRPLTPGYHERFDLYNLYHLLNHLNLFGTSYLTSVTAVLRRYG